MYDELVDSLRYGVIEDIDSSKLGYRIILMVVVILLLCCLTMFTNIWHRHSTIIISQMESYQQEGRWQIKSHVM